MSGRTVRSSRIGAVVSVVAAALVSACTGGEGPRLIEADVAAPETIPAIEVGAGNAVEPFGESRPASELPTVNYDFGEDLQLPDNNVGYSYHAGQTVDAGKIERLARFFDLPVEEVQFFDDAGRATGAQGDIEPNDPAGVSTPSVDGEPVTEGEVLGISESEALQQWTYANYDLNNPLLECDFTTGEGDSGVELDGEGAEPCDLPQVTGTPPTIEEAESRVRTMLESLDADPKDIVFDSFTDQFNTTVTAAELNEIGLRTGREWTASYGTEGRITSATGPFAVPEAVGPFELVGLDVAKQRVIDGVNTFGSMSSPAVAAESALAPDDGDGSRGVRSVRLVEVRPDLIWVWDERNNAWLVPAYGFIDAGGNLWTVPAVPDGLFTGSVGLSSVNSTVAPPTTPARAPTTVGDDFDVTDSTILGEDQLIDTTPLNPLLGAATLAEFVAAASESGATVRVARIDDIELALTEDFQPNRINVAITQSGDKATADELAQMSAAETARRLADAIVTQIVFVG